MLTLFEAAFLPDHGRVGKAMHIREQARLLLISRPHQHQLATPGVKRLASQCGQKSMSFNENTAPRTLS